MPPCPICGAPLTPVDGHPDWAPWLCQADARGFWPAELEHADQFRPATRDFAPAARDKVRKRVGVERKEAQARGHSRIPDHDRPPRGGRG